MCLLPLCSSCAILRSMDDRVGTAGTGLGQGQEDTILSLSDAAAALGISVAAVKKRVQREQLPGRKVDGRWYVVLDGTAGLGLGEDSGTGVSGHAPRSQPRGPAGQDSSRDRDTTTLAARAQLEAIRDEWLQPLVEQITDLSRQLGRVEAERDRLHDEVSVAQTEATNEHRRAEELRAERDSLQGRVRALEAEQTQWLVPGGGDAQPQPQRAWWRFWRP